MSLSEEIERYERRVGRLAWGISASLGALSLLFVAVVAHHWPVWLLLLSVPCAVLAWTMLEQMAEARAELWRETERLRENIEAKSYEGKRHGTEDNL